MTFYYRIAYRVQLHFSVNLYRNKKTLIETHQSKWQEFKEQRKQEGLNYKEHRVQ